MRVLALSLVAAVFVATVGLGWLFDNVFRQYLESENKAPLTSVTAIEKFGEDIRVFLSSAKEEHSFEQLKTALNRWPASGHYQLNITPLDSLSLPKPLQQQLVDGEPLTLASENDIAIYYLLPEHNQLLVLTSKLLNQKSGVTFNHYLLTALFYICLLLLMLLWIYPLLKRLLALRAAAKSFGKGDLSQRINVGSISYIRDVEIEFNHMAQRISDLVSDIKLLSSAVSHDLRTPLAAIRFGVDTLQEETDVELRKKFENRVSDNVDEMIELVEILLDYARLDQNLLELNKSSILLSPLLAQLANNINMEMQSDVITIHCDEQARVYADSKYLSMLIKNLLQNARQHCRQRVEVNVNLDTTDVILQIADDGPGIPLDEREHILKPFVRGEKKHKGYGIGLAIVHRIVNWHKGHLLVKQSDELGGALFEVRFPR